MNVPIRFNLPLRDVKFLFATLLLVLSTAAFAQLRRPYNIPVPTRDTSSFLIFKDVTAGPYLTVGIARQNEDVPDGWNASPRFSWAFGGTLDLAVNKWYGLVLSLLYDSRDLYLRDNTNDNIDLSLGYLSFQPSIRLFWLMVGLSFDIPMSGSATEYIGNYTRADQPATNNYNENLNVQTSDMLSMTELRATVSIPVLDNDNAMLHLVVTGSYPLGKAIAGTSSFDSTGVTTTNPNGGAPRFSGTNTAGKGPLPMIEAGITYQFDLIH
ncbi:MAG TPA: hypothetical protein VGM92_02365 [Candidatus Kapabacteria bacterium]|jgi:hypothetical protein